MLLFSNPSSKVELWSATAAKNWLGVQTTRLVASSVAPTLASVSSEGSSRASPWSETSGFRRSHSEER
jgi:hypothetical protein